MYSTCGGPLTDTKRRAWLFCRIVSPGALTSASHAWRPRSGKAPVKENRVLPRGQGLVTGAHGDGVPQERHPCAGARAAADHHDDFLRLVLPDARRRAHVFDGDFHVVGAGGGAEGHGEYPRAQGAGDPGRLLRAPPVLVAIGEKNHPGRRGPDGLRKAELEGIGDIRRVFVHVPALRLDRPSGSELLPLRIARRIARAKPCRRDPAAPGSAR